MGLRTYTYFFTHMEQPSHLEIGDIVMQGDILGIMGSTGISTAPHLHLGGAKGEILELAHLHDFDQGKYYCNPHELLYLIEDRGLFGITPEVTSGFADLKYYLNWGKTHYGYDVVPVDRHKSRDHFGIHWNRSKTGCVCAKGYDPDGYGYWIYIRYES